MSVRTRVAVLLAAVGSIVALTCVASAAAAEAVPRIAIFSPRTLQVVQRGAGGSADIRVRGKASGFDGARPGPLGPGRLDDGEPEPPTASSS